MPSHLCLIALETRAQRVEYYGPTKVDPAVQALTELVQSGQNTLPAMERALAPLSPSLVASVLDKALETRFVEMTRTAGVYAPGPACEDATQQPQEPSYLWVVRDPFSDALLPRLLEGPSRPLFWNINELKKRYGGGVVGPVLANRSEGSEARPALATLFNHDERPRTIADLSRVPFDTRNAAERGFWTELDSTSALSPAGPWEKALVFLPFEARARRGQEIDFVGYQVDVLPLQWPTRPLWADWRRRLKHLEDWHQHEPSLTEIWNRQYPGLLRDLPPGENIDTLREKQKRILLDALSRVTPSWRKEGMLHKAAQAMVAYRIRNALGDHAENSSRLAWAHWLERFMEQLAHHAQRDIAFALKEGAGDSLEAAIDKAVGLDLIDGTSRSEIQRAAKGKRMERPKTLTQLLEEVHVAKTRRSAGQFLFTCTLAVIAKPDGRLASALHAARAQLDSEHVLRELGMLVNARNAAMHTRSEREEQPPPLELVEKQSLTLWPLLGHYLRD